MYDLRAFGAKKKYANRGFVTPINRIESAKYNVKVLLDIYIQISIHQNFSRSVAVGSNCVENF